MPKFHFQYRDDGTVVIKLTQHRMYFESLNDFKEFILNIWEAIKKIERAKQKEGEPIPENYDKIAVTDWEKQLKNDDGTITINTT